MPACTQTCRMFFEPEAHRVLGAALSAAPNCIALGIIQSFIEVQHPAQFTGDSSISAVGAKESDTVRFQHRQLTVQHVSAGPTTEPRRTTGPAVYMKTHTHTHAYTTEMLCPSVIPVFPGVGSEKFSVSKPNVASSSEKRRPEGHLSL